MSSLFFALQGSTQYIDPSTQIFWSLWTPFAIYIFLAFAFDWPPFRPNLQDLEAERSYITAEFERHMKSRIGKPLSNKERKQCFLLQVKLATLNQKITKHRMKSTKS